MRQYLVLSLVALVAVIGAACSRSEPTPTTQPALEISPTPDSTDSVQPPNNSRDLLGSALFVPFTQNTTSIRGMGESGDVSYISVLLEIMRFPWLLNEETKETLVSSLARLIGQPEEELSPEQREWDWWVQWLGTHSEVHPPAGFDAWRGEFLSLMVDPETGAFLYEGVKARIRLEEIVWGGVSKDGIPDLINPPVVSAAEATYLDPLDRVFGVSINGEHRAYPLRILNPHEMANDVVGGVPLALAY